MTPNGNNSEVVSKFNTPSQSPQASNPSLQTQLSNFLKDLPTKEGYLRKRYGKVNQWSNRYFTLSSGVLSYRLKKDSPKIKAQFDLSPGSICTEIFIEPKKSKGKKLYSFWVIWPQHKEEEKASSVSEKSEVKSKKKEERSSSVTSNPKNIAKILQNEENIQKKNVSNLKNQVTSYNSRDSNLNFSTKLALVTLGGVIIGGLSVGLGLIPYLTIIGLGGILSGGGIIWELRKPFNSRIIFASEDLEDLVEWRDLILLHINKINTFFKPNLPYIINKLDINILLQRLNHYNLNYNISSPTYSSYFINSSISTVYKNLLNEEIILPSFFNTREYLEAFSYLFLTQGLWRTVDTIEGVKILEHIGGPGILIPSSTSTSGSNMSNREKEIKSKLNLDRYTSLINEYNEQKLNSDKKQSKLILTILVCYYQILNLIKFLFIKIIKLFRNSSRIYFYSTQNFSFYNPFSDLVIDLNSIYNYDPNHNIPPPPPPDNQASPIISHTNSPLPTSSIRSNKSLDNEVNLVNFNEQKLLSFFSSTRCRKASISFNSYNISPLTLFLYYMNKKKYGVTRLYHNIFNNEDHLDLLELTVDNLIYSPSSALLNSLNLTPTISSSSKLSYSLSKLSEMSTFSSNFFFNNDKKLSFNSTNIKNIEIIRRNFYLTRYWKKNPTNNVFTIFYTSILLKDKTQTIKRFRIKHLNEIINKLNKEDEKNKKEDIKKKREKISNINQENYFLQFYQNYYNNSSSIEDFLELVEEKISPENDSPQINIIVSISPVISSLISTNSAPSSSVNTPNPYNIASEPIKKDKKDKDKEKIKEKEKSFQFTHTSQSSASSSNKTDSKYFINCTIQVTTKSNWYPYELESFMNRIFSLFLFQFQTDFNNEIYKLSNQNINQMFKSSVSVESNQQNLPNNTASLIQSFSQDNNTSLPITEAESRLESDTIYQASLLNYDSDSSSNSTHSKTVKKRHFFKIFRENRESHDEKKEKDRLKNEPLIDSNEPNTENSIHSLLVNEILNIRSTISNIESELNFLTKSLKKKVISNAQPIATSVSNISSEHPLPQKKDKKKSNEIYLHDYQALHANQQDLLIKLNKLKERHFFLTGLTYEQAKKINFETYNFKNSTYEQFKEELIEQNENKISQNNFSSNNISTNSSYNNLLDNYNYKESYYQNVEYEIDEFPTGLPSFWEIPEPSKCEILPKIVLNFLYSLLYFPIWLPYFYINYIQDDLKVNHIREESSSELTSIGTSTLSPVLNDGSVVFLSNFTDKPNEKDEKNIRFKFDIDERKLFSLKSMLKSYKKQSIFYKLRTIKYYKKISYFLILLILFFLFTSFFSDLLNFDFKLVHNIG